MLMPAFHTSGNDETIRFKHQLIPYALLHHRHFIHQITRTGIFINHKQHIADVNHDVAASAAVKIGRS
jgi:hypothetical protein